jgi:hypothetical protein
LHRDDSPAELAIDRRHLCALLAFQRDLLAVEIEALEISSWRHQDGVAVGGGVDACLNGRRVRRYANHDARA